jgi:hypothetical protein
MSSYCTGASCCHHHQHHHHFAMFLPHVELKSLHLGQVLRPWVTWCGKVIPCSAVPQKTFTLHIARCIFVGDYPRLTVPKYSYEIHQQVRSSIMCTR